MYSGPPMPRSSWLTSRPCGPWKPARALAIRLRSGAFSIAEAREVVGRRRRAGLAGRGVGRPRAWRRRRASAPRLIAGPPCSASSRKAHELEAVAGGADLGVDLQAALQLRLVEAAERALEGEAVVGDVAAAWCRPRACASAGAERRGRAPRGRRGSWSSAWTCSLPRSFGRLADRGALHRRLAGAVVRAEVGLDRLGRRQRLLDDAEDRQDDEEEDEPVERRRAG